MRRTEPKEADDRIADPSPELCLIAGLIIAQTKGKPAKVRRMVKEMRAFVDSQREMASTIRLRSAEFDVQVQDSLERAATWLERLEPVLKMMARR